MKIKLSSLLIMIVTMAANAQIPRAPLQKTDSTVQNAADTSKTVRQYKGPGRSKESIKKTVEKKVPILKEIYDKRLSEKPDVRGKIKVKFAIDEFGKIIFCRIVESNANDSLLETEITEEIRNWKFEKIDKPGDVTEVIYPFVFERNYSLTSAGCILGIVSIILSLLFIARP